jgi:hypothetical protein
VFVLHCALPLRNVLAVKSNCDNQMLALNTNASAKYSTADGGMQFVLVRMHNCTEVA